jgi:hypothetical protein
MRVFHSLVYDENIESTNTATIDASWNSQLGLPDKLTIFALTDTVSVASTLNVQIEESPDQVHWMNKTGTAGLPELTLALATTQNTLGVGRDNGTTPSAGFVRLKLWLVAGSSPKAHVRLWVTGRGEQIP